MTLNERSVGRFTLITGTGEAETSFPAFLLIHMDFLNVAFKGLRDTV